MMTSLLRMASRPGRHGIRLRSLQVTEISALMTEVIKRDANLARIATQCNFRAAAASGMAKIYSRNVVRRKMSASQFAQSDFPTTRSAERGIGPSGLFRNRGGQEVGIFSTHGKGE